VGKWESGEVGRWEVAAFLILILILILIVIFLSCLAEFDLGTVVMGGLVDGLNELDALAGFGCARAWFTTFADGVDDFYNNVGTYERMNVGMWEGMKLLPS
jgi:hypothetical protein